MVLSFIWMREIIIYILICSMVSRVDIIYYKRTKGVDLK